MTHTVLIKPNNYLLFVEEDETVLDAAIRQGFDFPYSCRSATCATCMGRVLEGHITYGDVEPYALDEAAQADGYALFCSAKPTSDLVIEVQDVFGHEYKPSRTTEYKVDEQAFLGENLHQILLSPASDKKITYVAGQYLSIVCSDGIQVPFSIANAPVEGSNQIELHIHDSEKSKYTKEILNKIASDRKLMLKGPQGRMVYRDSPKLPLIFVAEGTGIAPLKAIIEDMLANNIQQEIKLYWRVKNPSRLYLDPLFKKWAANVPHFTYIPLFEDETISETILKAQPDLKGYQVFASGSPTMVYGLKKELIQHGLHPYFISSDVFECFPEEKV
jgi:CDP-4-dehydro-6-deoxyglucose reductase